MQCYWSIMMLCLLNEKDNLYLSLPNEMSDSDGICNKDAVCVKLDLRGTRGWHLKRDETRRIALFFSR